jgi:hypothetical protein
VDFKEIRLREYGLDSSSTAQSLLTGCCERKDEFWGPIRSGGFLHGLMDSIIPEEGPHFLNLISVRWYRGTKDSLTNWQY